MRFLLVCLVSSVLLLTHWNPSYGQLFKKKKDGKTVIKDGAVPSIAPQNSNSATVNDKSSTTFYTISGGKLNINPANSAGNKFEMQTPTGLIDRNTLASKSNTWSYTGIATEVKIKVQGNGKTAIINNQSVDLETNDRYIITGASLNVHLYNSQENGNAMGHWWITITGDSVTITPAPNVIDYNDYVYLTQQIDIPFARVFEGEFDSEVLDFQTKGALPSFFNSPTIDSLGASYYQTLTFRRTNDDFYPNLNVEYFYKPTDSLIYAAVYDWDIKNHIQHMETDGGLISQQLARKSEYETKYNEVKSELITKFGQPMSDTSSTSENDFTLTCRWDNADTFTELSLFYSTRLKVVGEFSLGEYRIRMKTYWKGDIAGL